MNTNNLHDHSHTRKDRPSSLVRPIAVSLICIQSYISQKLSVFSPVFLSILTTPWCTLCSSRSRIHERKISLGFLGIIFWVLRLDVSIYCTMFTLQTSFKPLLLKNPLIEVTVNSKKENSSDFCPDYIQEFGLCTRLYPQRPNAVEKWPNTASFPA